MADTCWWHHLSAQVERLRTWILSIGVSSPMVSGALDSVGRTDWLSQVVVGSKQDLREDQAQVEIEAMVGWWGSQHYTVTAGLPGVGVWLQ